MLGRDGGRRGAALRAGGATLHRRRTIRRGHLGGRRVGVLRIYSGPAGATVRLDLRPDGTFTKTWEDGARQWRTSGTWRTKGRSVGLESADRSHARLTLRHKGGDLYGVAVEPLPSGRMTTTSIDLHSVS